MLLIHLATALHLCLVLDLRFQCNVKWVDHSESIKIWDPVLFGEHKKHGILLLQARWEYY